MLPDNTLHGDLKTLLQFFLQQRAAPPAAYAHGARLLTQPSFFSIEKLQRLLNNPLLSPDWIDLKLNGRPIPLEPSYLYKTIQRKNLAYLDKSVIDNCLARGGAVVLEGIDILDPAINAFIAQVDEAMPCALSSCVAFFSQHGSEAYAGHCDSDDVLVVQIAGEKAWRIFEPQQRRYFNNAPLSEQQMGKQIAEVVMKAGDALWVRAGVPHICRTSGDHSLHLAFDLRDRTTNIEQITAEANKRYNHACEEPHAPASRVVDRYITLLQSTAFRADLELATARLKTEAIHARRTIGRASCIQALDKFIKAS